MILLPALVFLLVFLAIIVTVILALQGAQKQNEKKNLLFQELKADLGAELTEVPNFMGTKKTLKGTYNGIPFSIEEDLVRP